MINKIHVDQDFQFSFNPDAQPEEANLIVVGPSGTSYYCVSLLDQASGETESIGKNYLQDVEKLVKTLLFQQEALAPQFFTSDAAAETLQLKVTQQNQSYTMHVTPQGQTEANTATVFKEVFNSYDAIVTKQPIDGHDISLIEEEKYYHLEAMPWEIISQYISLYLEPQDLLALSLLNKGCRETFLNDELWARFLPLPAPQLKPYWERIIKTVNHSLIKEDYEQIELKGEVVSSKENYVSVLKTYDDLIIAGFYCGEICIWDFNGEIKWESQQMENWEHVVVLQIDQERLVAVSNKGDLALWDLETGDFIKKTEYSHDKFIVSPNRYLYIIDKYYISAEAYRLIDTDEAFVTSNDLRTRFYSWERETLEYKNDLRIADLTFTSPQDNQWTLCHRKLGHLLDMEVDDLGTITLTWSKETHPVSNNEVLVTDFYVRENKGFSYSNDGLICVWDLDQITCVSKFKIFIAESENKVLELCYYKDLLFLQQRNGSLQLWDLKGEPTCLKHVKDAEITRLRYYPIHFLPDQNLMITYDREAINMWFLWNFESSKPLKFFKREHLIGSGGGVVATSGSRLICKNTSTSYLLLKPQQVRD